MVGRWTLATCNLRHGLPWGRSHARMLLPWSDDRLMARSVGLLDADVLALHEVSVSPLVVAGHRAVTALLGPIRPQPRGSGVRRTRRARR